jgi:hypothetical protein
MADTPVVSLKRNRLKRLPGLGIGALFALIAAGWIWHTWRFPYGWSHCGDKGIVLALSAYAGSHNGRFPAGEATPEASLSLLYPQFVEAEILRGKTIRGEKAIQLLESGHHLTPETCDWHYVEGLTTDDDGRIAIFWDKIGLGHNGERIFGGGHSVGFVNGNTAFINGANWPSFLQEQQDLLAARKKR